MEQEMKKCTKCKAKKLISEFEKGSGGKHTSRCKKCASKYAKERTERKKMGKQKEKLIQSLNIKNNPLLFGELPHPSTKVQRIQMLPGDTDPFVEILCPCGNSMKLQYEHSFDSKNDYYEEVCLNCNKLFKMTITTDDDK